MNKITLNVPAGIKYLSEWKELWNLLPMNQHYILNKRICGVELLKPISVQTRK